LIFLHRIKGFFSRYQVMLDGIGNVATKASEEKIADSCDLPIQNTPKRQERTLKTENRMINQFIGQV
jgi:hypothetical protein